MEDASGFFEGVAFLICASYIFLGVSILCDVHLCPALDKLCDYLNMPTSLAAATFISFGSSAPELIISTLGAAGDKTELSIPAVLISALIAFAAIPVMVVWSTGPITLQVRGVVRDAIAYTIALVMFIVFNQGPEIGLWQASSLVAAYLVYLVVVYNTRTVGAEEEYQAADGELQRKPAAQGDEVVNVLTHCNAGWLAFADWGSALSPVHAAVDGSGASTASTGSTAANGVQELQQALLEKSEEADDEEESGPIMTALSLPFNKLFTLTIPDGSIGAFSMSMAWLCVLSYVAMWLAEQIAESWRLSNATAGITLLAWGGQLPDAIAAMALAKAGKPDEAISQAIASQVINVSIGIGLPLVLWNLIAGRPSVTQSHTTNLMVAVCVLVSIVLYLASIAPANRKFYSSLMTAHESHIVGTLTNFRAFLLAVGFAGCYAGSIVVAESYGAVA